MMNLRYSLLLLLIISFIGCKTESENKEIKDDAKSALNEEVKLLGEEITYKTDSTNLKGYIVYDENLKNKRPGILVVHEWWGHDEFARQKADELAELGYVALAVDMYGEGKKAKHPEEAMTFSSSVMKNFDTAKQRFLVAIETLKKNEFVNVEDISAIGFCFGGSVSLAMANSGVDLDGVAVFHSGISLPVMPNETLKAKILVQNGADDVMITNEQVQKFKSQLDSINADYEYIAYEGVKHSFTNKAADSIAKQYNLPLAYDQKAAEQSWQKMTEFFEEIYK